MQFQKEEEKEKRPYTAINHHASGRQKAFPIVPSTQQKEPWHTIDISISLLRASTSPTNTHAIQQALLPIQLEIPTTVTTRSVQYSRTPATPAGHAPHLPLAQHRQPGNAGKQQPERQVRMVRAEMADLEEDVFHGADGGFGLDFGRGRGDNLVEGFEDGGAGGDDVGA